MDVDPKNRIRAIRLMEKLENDTELAHLIEITTETNTLPSPAERIIEIKNNNER